MIKIDYKYFLIFFIFLCSVFYINARSIGKLTIEKLNEYENIESYLDNIPLLNNFRKRDFEYLKDSYIDTTENKFNIEFLKVVNEYIKQNDVKILINLKRNNYYKPSLYLISTIESTKIFSLNGEKIFIEEINLNCNQIQSTLKDNKFDKLHTIKPGSVSFDFDSLFVTVYFNGILNRFAIISPYWFAYGDEDTNKAYAKNKNHVEIAKLVYYKEK